MLTRILLVTLPALFMRLILAAVADRGSRSHATGEVSGSTYTVAANDTFYSIGLRFGLPYQDILRANNLPEDAYVRPGHKLTIPGLQPSVPPVKPPVQPEAGTRPYLFITSPTPGSTLNPRRTVVVTGTGGSLPGGQVLVLVKDVRGPILESKSTTLDNAGRWQVEFLGGVPVHAGSSAIIQAQSPSGSLQTSVTVNFR